MKHKTIIDIAKELNISVSTVSRALNNHPDIKENTKILVNKVAKKIGYVPNPIALSLRKNKTSTIGVIVPEIKHDFFSSAISGIEEIAYQSGYTIIVCQSNESYEREIINTRALMHHRVAVVFFDRVCQDVKASKVIIDDRKSAFNAVTHLINKGYKKIAHFGGPKELDICFKRFGGYKDALESEGIRVDNSIIYFGGLHEEDGYAAMSKLINENIYIDAVFAANDPIAIGAFQRIKEAGLRIPEDIGIIGFSNNKITSLVEPPLTTVNQPSFNMGKRAAEILIELINRDNIKIEPIVEVLDTELIIRKST
jgi:DNA-binding LacI/PurR family transcriptional regulator